MRKFTRVKKYPFLFTLIELLVVIAIIAVLAAMLLPSLSQARRMAERTDCMNQQKQIGIAVMMYADDFESYVPPNAGDGDGHTSRSATQIQTWADMQNIPSYAPYPPGKAYMSGQHGGITSLYPDYGATRDLFYCPAILDNKPSNGSSATFADFLNNGKYWLQDKATSSDPNYQYSGRIGYTYRAGVKVAGTYSIPNADQRTDYRNDGGVYQPFLEAKIDEIREIPAHRAGMRRPDLMILLTDITRSRDVGASHGYTIFAHDQSERCSGSNALFNDGHVTWFGMRGAWWANYQGQYYAFAGDVFIGSEGFVTGWRY